MKSSSEFAFEKVLFQMKDPNVALDERDEVQFQIFRQLYRQEGRAIDIQLLEKAPEQREFGKVRHEKGSV